MFTLLPGSSVFLPRTYSIGVITFSDILNLSHATRNIRQVDCSSVYPFINAIGLCFDAIFPGQRHSRSVHCRLSIRWSIIPGSRRQRTLNLNDFVSNFEVYDYFCVGFFNYLIFIQFRYCFFSFSFCFLNFIGLFSLFGCHFFLVSGRNREKDSDRNNTYFRFVILGVFRILSILNFLGDTIIYRLFNHISGFVIGSFSFFSNRSICGLFSNFFRYLFHRFFSGFFNCLFFYRFVLNHRNRISQIALNVAVLIQFSNQHINLFSGQWFDIFKLNITIDQFLGILSSEDDFQPVILGIFRFLCYRSVDHSVPDDHTSFVLVNAFVDNGAIVQTNVTLFEDCCFFFSFLSRFNSLSFFSCYFFSLADLCFICRRFFFRLNSRILSSFGFNYRSCFLGLCILCAFVLGSGGCFFSYSILSLCFRFHRKCFLDRLGVSNHFRFRRRCFFHRFGICNHFRLYCRCFFHGCGFCYHFRLCCGYFLHRCGFCRHCHRLLNDHFHRLRYYSFLLYRFRNSLCNLLCYDLFREIGSFSFSKDAGRNKHGKHHGKSYHKA